MIAETETMAEALRAWLEQRLGTPVTVLKPGDDGGGAVVTIESDQFSGAPRIDVIQFLGSGLKVRFEMREHDVSGECEKWMLDVRGAKPEDIEAIGEIFHPRNRKGPWGSSADVEYVFNGRSFTFTAA